MSGAVTDHAAMMDRIYRYTRHVYDLSREYFLLGRDRMLARIRPADGARVLEMGCGTARNLIRLARRYPRALYFGLDASRAMLEIAAQAARRAGVADRITLRFCYAEQMHPQETFGLAGGFDAIFFSYSLSMMPTWPQAIDAALRHLNPGGAMHVVDFWDQGGLPGFVARWLQRFLKQFHVEHHPELLQRLRALADEGWRVQIDSHYRRYAYLAAIGGGSAGAPMAGA